MPKPTCYATPRSRWYRNPPLVAKAIEGWSIRRKTRITSSDRLTVWVRNGPSSRDSGNPKLSINLHSAKHNTAMPVTWSMFQATSSPKMKRAIWVIITNASWRHYGGDFDYPFRHPARVKWSTGMSTWVWEELSWRGLQYDGIYP